MKTFIKIILYLAVLLYILFYGLVSGVFGGGGIAGYNPQLNDYAVVGIFFGFTVFLIVRFLYNNRDRK